MQKKVQYVRQPLLTDSVFLQRMDKKMSATSKTCDNSLACYHGNTRASFSVLPGRFFGPVPFSFPNPCPFHFPLTPQRMSSASLPNSALSQWLSVPLLLDHLHLILTSSLSSIIQTLYIPYSLPTSLFSFKINSCWNYRTTVASASAPQDAFLTALFQSVFFKNHIPQHNPFGSLSIQIPLLDTLHLISVVFCEPVSFWVLMCNCVSQGVGWNAYVGMYDPHLCTFELELNDKAGTKSTGLVTHKYWSQNEGFHSPARKAKNMKLDLVNYIVFQK